MTTDEVFAIEVTDGIIRVTGDLDAHTAPRLDDVVRGLIDAGAERIVVDMAAVEFVDSSGLRSLIRARADGADGREVVVHNPSAATLRLLDVTGMTEHFTVVMST